MSTTHVLIVFLLISVLVLAVFVWALSRQVGILFERIAPMGALVTDSGPAVGADAPVFSLPTLAPGRTPAMITIGGAGEKSTLLFFLSPTCPVCKKLLPIIKSISRTEKKWLSVVLASDGNIGDHEKLIADRKLEEFPYILSTELGMTYRVSKLPYAILISADGKVRSKGLINNREQIESLFNASEMSIPSIQQFIERGYSPESVSH